MKFSRSTLSAVAVVALSGLASHAQAYTTFIDMVHKTSVYAGVVTADFGSAALIGSTASNDPIFTTTVGGTTATYTGGSIYTASVSGVTAQPLGSAGGFWSIGPSPSTQAGPGQVTFSTAVKYYGFLWGSPDSYNDVTFSLVDTGTKHTSQVTVNGAIKPLPGDGNQAFSAYLNFYAGANENITGVRFASSSNALETDNHSFSVSAVPEPKTYAMLLAGLGVMGAIARRRKARQA
jgi:hypothetical protein